MGRDGQLFTREGIESVMSRNTYEEILNPDQDPQYSLEFHHGGAHVFVGGDMERLDTAAYDIVFFLHHAFVDYIWEMFRDKVRDWGHMLDCKKKKKKNQDFPRVCSNNGG